MEARYLLHCHQERLASLSEQLKADKRELTTVEAAWAEALSHLKALNSARRQLAA